MRKLPDINQTFYIEASPNRVFEALSDPDELAKWFPAKAMIDPVKGGRFSFVMKNGYVWEGKLSGFKQNRSVSYPFIEGTASFELVKKRRGTLLKLNNTGFETLEMLVAASGGWAYYLTNLKSVLEHGVDLRMKEDSF